MESFKGHQIKNYKQTIAPDSTTLQILMFPSSSIIVTVSFANIGKEKNRAIISNLFRYISIPISI